MNLLIDILAALGMVLGIGTILFSFSLAKAAGKKTPKPGRDYDERGGY